MEKEKELLEKLGETTYNITALNFKLQKQQELAKNILQQLYEIKENKENKIQRGE